MGETDFYRTWSILISFTLGCCPAMRVTERSHRERKKDAPEQRNKS